MSVAINLGDGDIEGFDNVGHALDHLMANYGLDASVVQGPGGWPYEDKVLPLRIPWMGRIYEIKNSGRTVIEQ